MNTGARSSSFFDIISVLSVLLQIKSLDELYSQTSSDDIYAELQRQDAGYLERILSNQEKIISMLSERNTKDDRV